MNIRNSSPAWGLCLVALMSCVPASGSELRLTVVGRVDACSYNSDLWVGIGPALGAGVLIQFGCYGGGCATHGNNINARGVSLDMQEDQCVFTGHWLWIEPSQFYTAVLTIDGSAAELNVPGVGVSTGTSAYEGPATILYIGRNSDPGNDPHGCAATIDAVTVEIKDGGGDWTLVDSEDFNSAAGFTSTDPDLYISDGHAIGTVYRNGGSQFLYRDLRQLVVDADSRSWGEIKALYK